MLNATRTGKQIFKRATKKRIDLPPGDDVVVRFNYKCVLVGGGGGGGT